MMAYFIKGVVIAEKALLFTAITWGILILALKIFKKDDRLLKKKLFYRELIFLAYSVTLLEITGIIGAKWQISGSILYNIIPFVNESPLLMMLNTILFIPFGILLPFTFQWMRTWRHLLITGGIVILSVELMQMLLTGRLFDIDDLIFNFTGVVIGYLLFILGRRIKIMLDQKDIRSYGGGSCASVVSLCAIVIGFPIYSITVADILLYQIGINVMGSYAYRISAIIPITLSVIGIIIGMRRNNDRYAKEGVAMSVICIVICLVGMKF